MTCFGAEYAALYDEVYAHKNYDDEAGALADLLESHGVHRGSCLLDYGCGTGRHMQALQAIGFTVLGVDSSLEMLKSAQQRLGATTCLMTTEEFMASPCRVDAGYSLFDVLSYQTDLQQLRVFFGGFTSKIATGGLVIAEAWHLPGMILQPPEPRLTDIELANGLTVTRVVTPRVDWLRSVVDLDLSISHAKSQELSETHGERHTLRAFTQLELSLLAAEFNLEVLDFIASITDPRPVDVTDWHITMVARKTDW